jgi:hypothetical protein
MHTHFIESLYDFCKNGDSHIFKHENIMQIKFYLQPNLGLYYKFFNYDTFPSSETIIFADPKFDISCNTLLELRCDVSSQIACFGVILNEYVNANIIADAVAYKPDYRIFGRFDFKIIFIDSIDLHNDIDIITEHFPKLNTISINDENIGFDEIIETAMKIPKLQLIVLCKKCYIIRKNVSTEIYLQINISNENKDYAISWEMPHTLYKLLS